MNNSGISIEYLEKLGERLKKFKSNSFKYQIKSLKFNFINKNEKQDKHNSQNKFI